MPLANRDSASLLGHRGLRRDGRDGTSASWTRPSKFGLIARLSLACVLISGMGLVVTSDLLVRDQEASSNTSGTRQWKTAITPASGAEHVHCIKFHATN